MIFEGSRDPLCQSMQDSALEYTLKHFPSCLGLSGSELQTETRIFFYFFLNKIYVHFFNLNNVDHKLYLV